MSRETQSFDAPSLANIGGAHLFRSLDEPGLYRLLQAATKVTYRPGQAIVREGEPGEALYVIRKGKVRVYTQQGQREIDLALLRTGACFGEVAMLTGRLRTANVVAAEECKLLCFHKRDIDKILESYPKVKKLLRSVVVSRARDTITKMRLPDLD